jgi:hypothetical protein
MVRPFHHFSEALLVGADAVTAAMVLRLLDHEAKTGGLARNKWATNPAGLKGPEDHAESSKIAPAKEENDLVVREAASNEKWWEPSCGHHRAGQADVDRFSKHKKDLASLPKGSFSLLQAGNNADHRPPLLSHLIGDLESDVIGDVQLLLDFAVVGHPRPPLDR